MEKAIKLKKENTESILFDFISKFLILSDEEKQAIIDLNIFSTVKKGTVLLKEGQISNKSYFILKGCIRVFYIVDGEEKTTAFYAEMEGITPPCVMNGKPSECFISCVENSIIMTSDTAMEEIIFEKFPKFESLCRIMSEQLLVKSQTQFDDLKLPHPNSGIKTC